MEKMGFPRDAEGLELSDEQLINFLLLCYQGQILPEEEHEEMEQWNGRLQKLMEKERAGNM